MQLLGESLHAFTHVDGPVGRFAATVISECVHSGAVREDIVELLRGVENSLNLSTKLGWGQGPSGHVGRAQAPRCVLHEQGGVEVLKRRAKCRDQAIGGLSAALPIIRPIRSLDF